MTNQEVVAKANKLLDDNDEWKGRYNGYADDLAKAGASYKEKTWKFQVNKPLRRCSSISMAKGAKYQYDIRYKGQSVGTVTVKKDTVFFKTSPKCDYYFNWSEEEKEEKGEKKEKKKKEEWKDFTEFRRYFKKLSEKPSESDSQPKSPERCVESILLDEFHKGSSKNKALINIQPVKLFDCYFQMKTPFSASDTNNIKYSRERGGGIDIMARVKHKSSNKTRICIFELKDENVTKEPQNKVIMQAIAYATFIGRLLTEKDAGADKWYKLFGFGAAKAPEHIDIDVATVMPNTRPDTLDGTTAEERTLKVNDRVTLHIHSLFYNSDFEENGLEFTGTLRDELM